jgi:hypothetical protein
MNRLQSILTKIESRLQVFFEGGAIGLFPDGDSAGLAQMLTAAMQAEIQQQPDGAPFDGAPSNGALLAPNVYTLIVCPDMECTLPDKIDLLNNLAALLQRSGEEANLYFLSPPVVRVITDAGLAPHEIQVLATFSRTDAADTTVLPLTPRLVSTTDWSQVSSNGMEKIPAAFLIVGGNRTVPLPRQGLTIGRQSDLSLVLKNPQVSRLHAQIRLVQDRYVIFDLDSRAGTYVNGQRVTQSVLHPGDVISLAGIQLVFGQEASGALDDTQEIQLK